MPDNERIITIEDPIEMKLQQSHVIAMEARPPNIEGKNEVTQRDLVRNALRMRPDRIVIGEVRGLEAFDMLQAMNTGHEGSLTTIHANSPRDGLSRIENMVMMAGFKLPAEEVREQIQSAVDLIIQIQLRTRDGKRRITQVTETHRDGRRDRHHPGICSSTIDDGENADGTLAGRFECTHLRPHFTPRAEYFGLGTRLLEAMGCRST